ncbi:hypothetical protein [Streptomyces sp. NPDC058657]|uniref:hypothetical protein n=1 Tax=unclassified Streptomyces TaxID=2593676 RepID=UPI003663F215
MKKPKAVHLSPPIPGVRYKAVERTRTTTTDINNDPRETPETYRVYVPRPARDLDRALRLGVVTLAVLVTTLAIIWSTASIGDLLAVVTVAAIAYGAAAVFDAAWIACMAVEWLERHDPKRAEPARNAGWAFLAGSVGAIVAHGWIFGDIAIGAVGGAVSVVAKGLWMIVMRLYAVPLGEGPRSWLSQRRQELAAEAVISAELRRFDTAQARHAALYGSSPAEATVQQLVEAQPEAELPQPPAEPPRRAPGEVLESELAGLPPSRAIKIVHDARPYLTLGQLAEVLAQYGHNVTDLDVAIVLGRTAASAAASRDAAAPHHTDTPPPQHVVITVRQPDPAPLAPATAAAPEQPDTDTSDAVMRAGQTADAGEQLALDEPPSTDRIIADAVAEAGRIKADAVRAVRKVLPTDASAAAVARHLHRHGIETDDAYVRTVDARDRLKAMKRAQQRAEQSQPEPGTGFYN